MRDAVLTSLFSEDRLVSVLLDAVARREHGASTVMPMRWVVPGALLTVALSTVVVAQDRVPQAGARPAYLGQPLPGETPVVFAPGVVSLEARELGIVFALEGREIYYTRVVGKLPMLFWRRLVNGTWMAEERLTLVAGQPEADHSDPAISPDGQRLYFVSGARNEVFKPGGNVWMSRREGNAWSMAALLPAPVNSDGSELYPVVVADGSLYFASNRAGGLGEQDLYRSQYRHGTFADAVNLGAAINTAQTEVDPYVSPDERMLLVAARRDGNRGALDLYVSHRRAGGSWGPLTSLGDAVNTELTDYCPMLSPDGQYFFFTRRTAQGGDIYWMRASALERLRPHP